MATTPVIYVREGRNTWHIVRPGDPADATLCRRVPVDQWDSRATKRPDRLCKRCAELSA